MWHVCMHRSINSVVANNCTAEEQSVRREKKNHKNVRNPIIGCLQERADRQHDEDVERLTAQWERADNTRLQRKESEMDNKEGMMESNMPGIHGGTERARDRGREVVKGSSRTKSGGREWESARERQRLWVADNKNALGMNSVVGSCTFLLSTSNTPSGKEMSPN